MNKKEFKVIGEFYDISRYIGLISPDKPIYESLQGGEELIVLTEDKLITVKDDSVAFEVDLSSVRGCNFTILGKTRYLVDITTTKDLVSLEFHRKNDTLRFLNNILKNLRH